ncbi:MULTISPECIES: DMT family transporter [unclassified Kaistella]|uniref:DMT family transporter n=1 Tax=unclassified Kaistella TaxID=2762626 RepID=UPI002734370B|nr:MULTISPECIES: EamA family transporter [unclassified Kaistella]MDP2453415.1 EamA family transporter [Kaistella sp. SH11-4b]MDP2456472.1 EamA family transporter [Kaistella sp. SH40-3]MDP2459228.1 EamA family transporter [Kaistella sp. SH19-2b]
MFKDPKLVLAIVIVALVWGTTFLGIRIAVETIPPWFVAGLRQFLAGIILLVVLLFTKNLKWIGWKNYINQIILASLMLVVANGMTTVAEKHLTSSLASLISSTSPLAVFILSIVFSMQKFSIRGLVGVLLGFSGILLIFKDGLQDLLNPEYRMGVVYIFIAIGGWAFGTIYTKKTNHLPQNISLNLFYQFSFAGIVQIIFGFIASDEITVFTWSSKSILATIYLAIFGSVIAFFAFHYALKKITPTQISILSYVNTIIAIFLGWLILNEPISLTFIMATVLIICGVFITNYQKGMFAKK